MVIGGLMIIAGLGGVWSWAAWARRGFTSKRRLP